MEGNSRQLLASGQAQDDLLDIWHFGAFEWSPERADHHLRAIGDIFERLRKDPQLGRKRDDLLLGLRSLPVLPHIVFYRQTGQTIEIVRVLHQSSDTQIRFRQ